MYVSEDGVQTWVDASDGLVGRELIVLSVVFSGDGTVLYAGMDDGIFRGTIPRKLE